MPYALTLKAYVLPEFEAQAPDSWENRLREISPVLPDTSHLRFRKFEPRGDWSESPYNLEPDRPLWAAYSCTPKHLVHPDKVERLRLHWSELPTDQQVGRRALVSNYQHFMWHSQGVLVQPFWLLQGAWGGTPTMYTARETRYLDGSGLSSIPAPPGAFTPCVFDERAVKAIVARDRLVQAGNRFDELEKMDRPEAKKAEDDAAELEYRQTVIDTLAELAAPAVEFMKTTVGKTQANEYLRPAPKGLETTLATWKDIYKETGRMVAVSSAPMRKLHAVS